MLVAVNSSYCSSGFCIDCIDSHLGTPHSGGGLVHMYVHLEPGRVDIPVTTHMVFAVMKWMTVCETPRNKSGVSGCLVALRNLPRYNRRKVRYAEDDTDVVGHGDSPGTNKVART